MVMGMDGFLARYRAKQPGRLLETLLIRLRVGKILGSPGTRRRMLPSDAVQSSRQIPP